MGGTGATGTVQRRRGGPFLAGNGRCGNREWARGDLRGSRRAGRPGGHRFRRHHRIAEREAFQEAWRHPGGGSAALAAIAHLVDPAPRYREPERCSLPRPAAGRAHRGRVEEGFEGQRAVSPVRDEARERRVIPLEGRLHRTAGHAGVHR